MDWLVSPKEKLNCYERILDCEDEKENTRILQDIQNPVSVRKITTLELNKFSRKGCPFYCIKILNSTKGKELRDEDHPVLLEFRDVFPKDVSRLPPKRDLDFSINLVHASRVIYKMSMPELKMHLKEIMDKGYIKLSVSPWVATSLL